ncbi:MerR family transcriptional regulator, partial [Parasutterella excrementihominis]|uniref:MerR family transcriptional regulator n=1 Tax=Parasutterella excrementihominis TaxID=487175 RepID=UPI003519C1F2
MLKTAEFAKMCHTTKDTLIFYDRIDVFKPAFVDSKKYRYYEVRQAVQFAFLSHLRDIGFSLEEIKEFINVNFQRFPTLDAKKLVNAPKMSAHHR